MTMDNPVKAMLGDNCADVYVWGAEPYIKEALSSHADVWISYSDIKTERVLYHNAAMRPISKLPWPLSKIQAHDVRLTIKSTDFMRDVVKVDKPLNFDRIFSWNEVDDAIKLFLARLSPKSTVRIMLS